MSAKPIYVVRLNLDIGMYLGEWDGHEEKYERQSHVLLRTESKLEAEALIEKMLGRDPYPQTKGEGGECGRAGKYDL